MSDTNGSVSIDSISLEITSNSAQAVDSINKLASSLGALNSKLSGKGINNMSKIALGLNSIARSGSKMDLSRAISQLSAISNINLKPTGITSFANAMTKMSEKSANIDVSVFTKLANEMKNLGEVSSSSTDFLKSVTSLVRASDKMQTAAQNFPTLASGIKAFFDSMANVEVSDNVVRVAESLSDVSKSAARADTSMKGFTKSSETSNKSFVRLNATFDLIRSGYKALGSTLKNLSATISNFASKAISGVTTLAQKLKEMTSHKQSVDTLHFSLKSLLTTLIGFRGITGVFSWTKDALEAGGSLTEIDHIVDSVYGDMSDSVKAWADGMIDNYGIASTAAKQYAGTLTAMAKASGVAQETAAVMGMDLTQAAGDISAFFNIDTAEAFQKIQSGLAGQVRPLRSLGIDLTAATLKEYALAQGIEKSYSDMTQAEKVMLRYDYIMNVLSSDYEKGIGVLGDYERTQYSYQNSLRKLQAYLSAIRTQIGAGLTAAIRPVIVALNQLMAKLLSAAKAFTTFMQTLFPFQNGASGLALADAANSADDLADGADSAADGLSDADDYAKKLKKDLSVLPFDELNQLNKDRESASTSKKSVGGTDAIPSIGTEGLLDWDGLLNSLKDTKIPDAVDAWAKRIKDAFERHDWAGLGNEIASGINGGIEWLYDILNPEKVGEKINPYIDAFTTTMNSLVAGIDFETLGGAIGEGMTIVFNAANRFMTQFDWVELGRQLGRGANGLINAIDWKSMGEFFANKINAVLGIANGLVNEFSWVSLGGDLADGANSFVNQIDFDLMVDTVSTGIGGISDTVSTFAKNFKWGTHGSRLARYANKLVNKIDKNKLVNAISKTLSGITTFVKSFALTFDWPGFGETLASFANDLVTKINFGDMVDTVDVGLNGIIDTVNQFLEDFEAGEFGTKLGTAFTKLIGGVEWTDLGNALANIWNDAWDFMKNFVLNLGRDTSMDGLTTDALRAEKFNANKVANNVFQKSSGTGLGQAIYQALKTAIENVKVEDMIDTINTLVAKVCEDIVDAFGDQSMWYDLGHKIGETLSGIIGNPENAKKAAAAINALADGLANLFSGAIDAIKDHMPAIRSAINRFLADVKWGEILGIAAPFIGASLAAKIGTLAFAKTKEALANKIASIFLGVGKADKVVSAGGTIFQSVTESIGSAGALSTQATLIGATVIAAQKIYELIDLMKGGNGIATEEGGIIDSFIGELAEMQTTTKNTRDKLFDLKEEWESGQITDDDFFSKAVKLLKDGGVNADEAKGAVDRLNGKINITNTQSGILENLLSGIADTAGQAKTQLNQFGIEPKEGIEKVKDAISSVFLNVQDVDSALPGLNTDARTTFDEMAKNGSTFGEALKTIIDKYDLTETEVAELRTAVDEKLGQEGIFDAFINGIDSAKTSTDALVTSTNTAATNITTEGTNADTTGEKLKTYSGTVDTAKTKTTDFGSAVKTASDNTSTQAANADTANTKISGLSDIFGTAKDVIGKYGSAIKTAYERTATQAANAETADSKVSGLSNTTSTATQKISSYGDAIKTAADNTSTQATNAETATSEFGNLETGSSNLIVKLKDLAAKAKTSGDNIKTQGENAKTADGYMQNYNDTNAKTPSLFETVSRLLGTVLTTLLSTYGTKKDFEDKLKDDVEGAKDGINNNKYLVTDAAESAGKDAADAFASTDATGKAYSSGESLINQVASGMRETATSVDTWSIAKTLFDGFGDYIDSITGYQGTAWTWGHNVIQQFVNGLNSVKVELPHIEWDQTYTRMWTGEKSYVDVPNYTVNWYKKGGLFTNPSIVGVGEAGNEAVLPLENRRTMGMIASEIINSSNGLGMDENTLANAVARGYVQAMMANQGNQQQPIFNIVVKTESDEVLARAVQRGNRSIDYRENPTPQFGY